MASPLLQTTRSNGVTTVILPEGSIFAGSERSHPFASAQVSEPPTSFRYGMGGACCPLRSVRGTRNTHPVAQLPTHPLAHATADQIGVFPKLHHSSIRFLFAHLCFCCSMYCLTTSSGAPPSSIQN